MKKIINSLAVTLSAAALLFAAACAYSFADVRETRNPEASESSERSGGQPGDFSASQTDKLCGRDGETDTSKERSASAAPTEKSDAKSEKANVPWDEQTGETAVEAETDIIILQINEVGADRFTATSPWPSQFQYEVIYKLDKKFKSGDIVDVSYNVEDGFLETMPIRIMAISVKKSDFKLNPNVAYKPVIYLYPEEKARVSVKLVYNGIFTKTIPEYGAGWEVTAYPDGRIINSDGSRYSYLFWEGKGRYCYDLSRGFCVEGARTETFLREKLAMMGLSKSEADDFIEFWAPRLQKNAYNKICFQTTAHTDNARLLITPEPDSVIRVFMVFTPLEKPINIKGQALERVERKGFTVVEWGGALSNG